MGASPAREVRLGENRQLDRGEDEPALEWRDLKVRREAVLVEQPPDAGDGPLTVGADDDPVTLLAQVDELTHQPLAVADDRIPPHRLDGRDVRPFRRDR